MSLTPLFLVHGIYPTYSSAQEGFSLENIPDSMAYIIDSQGWKILRKSKVSTSLINVDKIEGISKLEESIALSSPKIPLNLIRKVTAFFKKVYDRNKTEAIGYLYFKESTQEWDFVPPVQINSSAAASSPKVGGKPTVRLENAPKLEDGWRVAGTIHSHGNMTAFHSGVDDSDEALFEGVHITIGKLDAVPEYACSIMSQGARAKYNPADLIDGMSSESDIPDSWLEVVKVGPATGIDDDKLAKKAEKLYEKYMANKISEDEYLEEIEKIEEADDKPIIDATKPGNFSTSRSFLDDSRFIGGSNHVSRGWKYSNKSK